MIKLEDAFFGYTIINPNSKKIELEPLNLFKNLRVKYSVAFYKVYKNKMESLTNDPLRFCFGDVKRRTEYEFLISSHLNDKRELFDVYDLYVEPNKELLMSIIDNISVESCNDYLKEVNKEREKWKTRK